MKKLGKVAYLQRGFDLPNKYRVDGSIPIISSSGISGYHNEAQAKAPGVITGRCGVKSAPNHSRAGRHLARRFADTERQCEGAGKETTEKPGEEEMSSLDFSKKNCGIGNGNVFKGTKL